MHPRPHIPHLPVLWLLAWWLLLTAACTSDEPLPTLAQVPTAAEERVPSPTSGGRATLPPSWTPEPTATDTPSPAPTATPSVTPSATITDTPSPTPTDLPTIPPEERPLTGLLQAAAAATLLPTDYVVPGFQGIEVTLPAATAAGATVPPAPGATQASGAVCPYPPPGTFAVVYSRNPELAQRLGCPTSPQPVSSQAAVQSFQQGEMIWLASQGSIYVFYSTTRAYQRYTDTFDPAVDPETSGETPPQGFQAPVRGFLKVWANDPAVRSGLGWATGPEAGTQAQVQSFASGVMIQLTARPGIYALIGSDGVTGTWFLLNP